MAASHHDDDDMAELMISSLPLETWCPPFPLRNYGSFWMPEPILPGIAATRTRFQPRSSDVFLGSFPKSGTTWLKALAFATLHRADHPPRHPDHPLRRRNLHDCVDFLEMPSPGGRNDAFSALPLLPVLATHIPYHLLPVYIRAEGGSGGRIVYICRDPKDALVSMWLFTKKKPYTIEEALELFCDGRCIGGPQWRHVAGYWEPSRRWPEKVLFLRYEEMLSDLLGNVRRLAEFTGCVFSNEEEATGVLKDTVDLCSIDVLKNMEVNKNGCQKYMKNESFQKGLAGDRSNHMTPAMAEHLDKVVEEALRGSGFRFVDAQST